jgi:predicted nuclease of restriction endonuclease-like RecB superfamily
MQHGGGEALAPKAALSRAFDVAGGEIIPRYVTEKDYPWLRAMLEEYERYVGCRRAELDARLASTLVTRWPKAKLRMALHVIDRLARTRTLSVIAPRRARAAVFRAVAMQPPDTPRDQILADVAVGLGTSLADLDDSLFADLPGEKRVRPLCAISPSVLAREVNSSLVASMLARAITVNVRAWGKTRALVRHARLIGLICVVRRDSSRDDGVLLEVSGPFALFRRTELYGRALASLLPRLAWCERYELRAACELPRSADACTLVVRSGDPIAAARELPKYDSKLEERFARDFGRVALDWDLVREPLAIDVSGTLIFPDFELRHRHDKTKTWLLEIAGFWTPEYVAKKLDLLRRAGIKNLILCIDAGRDCAAGDLAAATHVVRYRRRIDPRDILRIVEGHAARA